MTGVNRSVIFGTVSGDEPVVRLNLEIRCSSCKKTVPGGVTISKRHYGSDGFDAEIQAFMRGYLCGICRDKKRVGRRNSGQAHAGRAGME